MPHRPRAGTTVAALAVFAAAVGFGVLTAPAADAATPRPAVPHVAKVVTISSSGFTVRVRKTAHATSFRVFAATTRRALHLGNIRHARHSAIQRSRLVKIRRLRYRSTPYYYRIEAFNGKRHRWDTAIHAVQLRPPKPTGLRATSGTSGAYLTWRAQQATAWVITQATSANLRHGRRTYRIGPLETVFTPYRTTKGHRYWFAIQAVNGTTRSARSATVRLVPRTRLQGVRVATYNVLEDRFDGTIENGTVVAPWAQRRGGVVASIRKSGADVVAVQEAADWVGEPAGYGGTRMIDDLRNALGSGWALASTERPPTEHGYFRTGDYLLYEQKVFQAVGAGGYWAVGNSRWAAFQLLRSRSTGARIVAVSTHLTVGSGARYDTTREQETRQLLKLGTAYGRSAHAVIVYAGDYNSAVNRNHVFDGPALAMRAVHAADARDVAQKLVNAQYNSANQYLRVPPTFGGSIDHIYVAAGVGVVSRAVVLDLVHGRFPGVIPSDHNLVVAQLAIPA